MRSSCPMFASLAMFAVVSVCVMCRASFVCDLCVRDGGEAADREKVNEESLNLPCGGFLFRSSFYLFLCVLCVHLARILRVCSCPLGEHYYYDNFQKVLRLIVV